MNILTTLKVSSVMLPILWVTTAVSLFGQQQTITLQLEEEPVKLKAGESVGLAIKAVNQQGQPVEGGRYQYFMLRSEGMVPTSGAAVDSTGVVTGHLPGKYRLVVIRAGSGQQSFARKYVELQVLPQDIVEVELTDLPARIYSGTSFPLFVKARDKNGSIVDILEPVITSSNSDLARIDALNYFHALQPGKVDLKVEAGGITNSIPIKILTNPVAKLKFENSTHQARTGDVLTLKATAYDKNDSEIPEVPVNYSVSGKTKEDASGASAIITDEGKFVAEEPGTYTIIASAGNNNAIAVAEIAPRKVQREIKMTGHGLISNKHTSDLWVWEGVDGGDYAVTGTWSADGTAYFWDVTDPGNLKIIDSIKVDARTVNDVKVSEDGRICVISREGASNRKNGMVILDVTQPAEVRIISTFDDQLTGGVHNLFIHQNHVYALSNGQRYDVINIEDPAQPHRVGSFKLDNPARAIHDVWVEDGIAYSSNWNDGVVMVDVGNGLAGGSPEQPVEIARYRVQGDANHAAFPYKSKDTGKFYVIAGDEIFPINFQQSEVFVPDGYLHFIDFTDLDHPKEVARYQIPEAGSHNFWVEGDLLYIAYYNGGLRVLDISGELLGDLYQQGREVAHFVPLDRNGVIPNAAMTWGAQPHKGHIFFSDHNSGLWAAKLEGEAPQDTRIQAK